MKIDISRLKALFQQNANDELKQILFSYKKIFYIVGFFTAIINILMIVPALYMFQIYDSVLSSRSFETLLMLSLIAILMYIVYGFLTWARSQILVHISNDFDARLRSRTFNAVLTGVIKTGTISPAQAFGDLANIRQFVTGPGIFAFFDAPWAFIYLIVIFMIHPVLGLFATVAGIVQVIGAVVSEKATKNKIKESNKYYQEASNFLQANIRNAEVIEAMGMHKNVMARWYDRYQKMLLLQSEGSEAAGKIQSVIRFLRITSQSLILGLGAYFVIENKITPGMMIMGSILMGRALAPIDTVVGMWRQFVSARDSYERFSNLLSNFPEPEKHLPLPPPRGFIKVENAFVGPPGKQIAILKNINFETAPGEVVGIIGPTASGKTTLAKTLVGVWTPTSGNVRIDGADITHYNRDELGRYIGYLPQDIELFTGTIAENIARFGEINMDYVIKAATIAGIHEMILQFPKGYETEIGEGGSFLSGGQRQRIALARAIYGDPVLIVLDEPNSNLDDQGEMALMRAIMILKKMQRTVFVISHRMNLLSTVDKIIFMTNGTIQLYGPRDEVLNMLLRRKTDAEVEPKEKIAAKGSLA
jgi:ATP-binding cassette subfamily C exporter for protease/lipase/ATP-binding cassette subfamily C protein EexD